MPSNVRSTVKDREALTDSTEMTGSRVNSNKAECTEDATVESKLSRLGKALNARTTDVVDEMMRRSVTSGLLLDKVVEESFEQVGTVSTVAVARWMAGEGETVAREVGQESWRIFAQLASQREAPLNEVTKRCLRWRDSTAEVLSSSASELELDDPHDAAADEKWHRHGRPETGRARKCFGSAVLRGCGVSRFDDDGRAAPDRIPDRALVGQAHRGRQWRVLLPIPDHPGDICGFTVVVRQHHEARVGVERVERLLKGSLDDGARSAGLSQGSGQRGEPIGLSCGLFGDSAAIPVALHVTIRLLDQQAEPEPARDIAREERELTATAEMQKRTGFDDDVVDG